MTVHAGELARRLLAARGSTCDACQEVERNGVLQRNHLVHEDLTPA